MGENVLRHLVSMLVTSTAIGLAGGMALAQAEEGVLSLVFDPAGFETISVTIDGAL